MCAIDEQLRKSSFKSTLDHSLHSHANGGTLKALSPERKKPRNAQVAILMDDMHLYMQVICNMHTCIKNKKKQLNYLYAQVNVRIMRNGSQLVDEK